MTRWLALSVIAVAACARPAAAPAPAPGTPSSVAAAAPAVTAIGEVTFTYDARGRLRTADDVELQYDARGRVTHTIDRRTIETHRDDDHDRIVAVISVRKPPEARTDKAPARPPPPPPPPATNGEPDEGFIDLGSTELVDVTPGDFITNQPREHRTQLTYDAEGRIERISAGPASGNENDGWESSFQYDCR